MLRYLHRVLLWIVSVVCCRGLGGRRLGHVRLGSKIVEVGLRLPRRRRPPFGDGSELQDRYVSGTAGAITQSNGRCRFDDQIITSTAPLPPTRILRIAATCQEESCRHFSEGRCAFAAKLVRMVPEATDALPACTIRARCRWFAEQGRTALPTLSTGGHAECESSAPHGRCGESARAGSRWCRIVRPGEVTR